MLNKKKPVSCMYIIFKSSLQRFNLASQLSFYGTVLEENARKDDEVFEKWQNGGGIFHKSACIDPTAHVELGAYIHARCHICANVHIGSGAIIGPDVTIGQSTTIGYNLNELLSLIYYFIKFQNLDFC